MRAGHFNVSVIVRDKVTKGIVHKPQPFWRERRAEAVSNRGPSAVYQLYRRPNRLKGSGSGGRSLTLLVYLPCFTPESARISSTEIKMADSVDIDLYDNIEDEFNQVWLNLCTFKIPYDFHVSLFNSICDTVGYLRYPSFKFPVWNVS